MKELYYVWANFRTYLLDGNCRETIRNHGNKFSSVSVFIVLMECATINAGDDFRNKRLGDTSPTRI